MPPLFPYQAIMSRPQTGRTGEYVSQSTSPPANEILDTLLTGYLWGSLLVALFLVVYCAISFCVWAIGAALTTIDMVIDCLRPCDNYRGADTDTAMTTWLLPDKYNTVYLEQNSPQNENDISTWPRDKPGKDLRDVLAHTERETLLEDKGVKNCSDSLASSESIGHPIHHTPSDSEDTIVVETMSNTVEALKPLDYLVVTFQR